MFRTNVALVLTFLSFPLLAQDPDIRELMTPSEFSAAGLNNLSDDQLSALNDWLIRYTAEDATRVIRSSPAVRENTQTVRTRIDGEFNGWNGTTRFRLQNGQVWETRTTRRYSYTAMDPEVELNRNFLGVYRMTVIETGQSIAVRRIE